MMARLVSECTCFPKTRTRISLEAPMLDVGGLDNIVSCKFGLLESWMEIDCPTIQNLERNSVITKQVSPSKWAMIPLEESLPCASFL